MATSSSAVFLLAYVLIISASWNVDAGGDEGLSWVPTKPSCEGSVAECMADEEFNMDTEISRRILATSQYISYGALQRNTVPCSRRGASYYNCKPGAQRNPYSRGCSSISRCRN